MGPNSNSNQWFGTKVSQVGTPVNQASDTQLIYKSNFSTNLFNGPGGIWKVMEGTRVPTIGNGLTAPQQGFWIAQDGVDVQQATDEQMVFNSSVTPTGVLGYTPTDSLSQTNTGTIAAVPSLSVTADIPEGSQLIEVIVFIPVAFNATAGAIMQLSIWEGIVGVGTQIGSADLWSTGGYFNVSAIDTPPPGLTTYNVGIATFGGGTSNISSSTGSRAYILVKLLQEVR